MRRLLLSVLLLCAASLSAQTGFFWEFDGSLESRLGYGTLDSFVSSAPQEFGPNGFLDRGDLESAAGDYAPQLSFSTSLSAELLLRWTFNRLAVESVTSLLVLHSPFGYHAPASLALAPQGLGVRVLWLQGWSGWGFAAHGGRIRLTDPSELVVDQLVDGLSLAAGTNSLYFEAGAGFTGLLDKYLYTPRLIPADGLQFAQPGYFAENRFLAQLRAEALLPAEQRLSLFGVLYLDTVDPVGSGSVRVGLAGAGPVLLFGGLSDREGIAPDGFRTPERRGTLGYETVAVVLIPFDGSSVGLFLSTLLELQLPGVPLAFGLGGAFASGGASLGTYAPVTPTPQGSVAALPLSNLVKLDSTVRANLSTADTPTAAVVRNSVYFSANPPTGGAAFSAFESAGGLEILLLNDLELESEVGLAVSTLGVTAFLTLGGRVSL